MCARIILEVCDAPRDDFMRSGQPPVSEDIGLAPDLITTPRPSSHLLSPCHLAQYTRTVVYYALSHDILRRARTQAARQEQHPGTPPAGQKPPPTRPPKGGARGPGLKLKATQSFLLLSHCPFFHLQRLPRLFRIHLIRSHQHLKSLSLLLDLLIQPPH